MTTVDADLRYAAIALVALLIVVGAYHRIRSQMSGESLDRTREGDGSLLDRCMIVYGSGLSDGNQHLHENLPTVIAGRGNGTLSPGRHIRYAAETPMANFFVALLDRMGVPAESMGDSTGKIGYLNDLG